MGKQDAKRISCFPPQKMTEVYRSTEGKMKVDFFLFFFFYYAVLLTRGTHHPGYIIAFSLDGVFATKERRAAFISAFATHVKAQPIRKHGRSTVSIFSPSNISVPVVHIKLVNLYRSKKIRSLGNRILTKKKKNCIRFVATSLKTTTKRNDPLLSFLVSSILGNIAGSDYKSNDCKSHSKTWQRLCYCQHIIN